MRTLGIIPARYSSSRFPGKPLAVIKDKPMVMHVYERALEVLDEVVIATDDKRILYAVEDYGGKAIMTSEHHTSGTERCAEALQLTENQKDTKFDLVINIQGDEPLIAPQAIKLLTESFAENDVKIATLANEHTFSAELENPNIVKIIVNNQGFANYFSRFAIPFVRDKQILPHIKYYTHIGIYAYRPEILKQIVKLPVSNSEKAEKLEQNRWLDNGYTIKVLVTDYKSVGVDTPEDLSKILKMI